MRVKERLFGGAVGILKLGMWGREASLVGKQRKGSWEEMKDKGESGRVEHDES